MAKSLDLTTELVTLEDGRSFSTWQAGPAGGELVVLLHGFPQSRHAWRSQLPALADAGYRAVAPDQRGYSPGVRPDPTRLAEYQLDVLVQDVIDLADACGPAEQPIHLVGHDWGGMVAWATAFAHPARIRSLAVLSRPHPAAFAASLAASDGDQRHRSRHHRAFLDDGTAGLLLADNAARLRRLLLEGRVPASTVEDYVSVLGEHQAMDAALAWYRATPKLAASVGTIEVPTLYVWGNEDASVGRAAAEATGTHVAASYCFVELEGVGHFASDEQPDRVNELLLEHLSRRSAH